MLFNSIIDYNLLVEIQLSGKPTIDQKVECILIDCKISLVLDQDACLNRKINPKVVIDRLKNLNRNLFLTLKYAHCN